MCLSGSDLLEQGYCTDENNRMTESKINAMLCGKQNTKNFADQMETGLKIIRWKVNFVNITTWHGLVHSHALFSYLGSCVGFCYIGKQILYRKFYFNEPGQERNSKNKHS